MAEYQVWYVVPLAAHVNVETGEVTRVVVIDESVKLEAQPMGAVTLDDYSAPAPDDVAKRAVEIAEAATWPVWENGY